MQYFMSSQVIPTEKCKHLRDQKVEWLTLGLSIFLVVGILVSYLPQHYRIIARRTSEGISSYFILLGTISCTSALANIIILSRSDVACCTEIPASKCFDVSLGIAQLGVQWLCFSILFLLFLIFFPRNPRTEEVLIADQPSWRNAIIVAIICAVHGFVVILITAMILLLKPVHLKKWADALGVMATILGALQYLPQIWTTFIEEDIGSLSIPMMLIQTPGSFVFALSLGLRLGWEGWSSWGLFLVTGTLQGILLTMAIIFELRKRNKNAPTLDDESTRTDRDFARNHIETDDEGSPFVENGSERTPLIKRNKKASRSEAS